MSGRFRSDLAVSIPQRRENGATTQFESQRYIVLYTTQIKRSPPEQVLCEGVLVDLVGLLLDHAVVIPTIQPMTHARIYSRPQHSRTMRL